jgi:diazepam-binding inhibitor (GABA receptor modulating acyl-CoA-binding protein)
MEEKFKKAAEDIKKISEMSDENLLYLYGLYKQATCGDCNITRPSFFDPKGQAKYDAWDSRKGLEKEKAQKKYISKVENLLNKK